MYQLANKTDGSSQVAGKFDVAPLPGLSGPGASTVGGYNLAVSPYAKNKATALDFIKFFTNMENEKLNMQKNSNAPIYTSLYDDPALVQQAQYLPILKQAILNAKARPKAVRYNDVTTAIQEAAYGAVTGTTPPDKALADLQAKLAQLTTQ
jgi:multiple sugar transport system substrate-binding protein